MASSRRLSLLRLSSSISPPPTQESNDAMSDASDAAATRRLGLSPPPSVCGTDTALFEACRTGDLTRVRRQVSTSNVNARDTAGRKSTPLHFAAGTKRTTPPQENDRNRIRFEFSTNPILYIDLFNTLFVSLRVYNHSLGVYFGGRVCGSGGWE